MVLNDKTLSEFMDKVAVSQGYVAARILGRLAKAPFSKGVEQYSNVMGRFANSSTRAGGQFKSAVEGVQKMAPKPMPAAAPAAAAAPKGPKFVGTATDPSFYTATPKPNRAAGINAAEKYLKREKPHGWGRRLAGDAALGVGFTGAAVLGGASSAFASNPYEPMPQY